MSSERPGTHGDCLRQRLCGPGRDGGQQRTDPHRHAKAEAYSGPSLILAYSQCIARGIDMRFGLTQAARATANDHWLLFRFHPNMRQRGMNPFRLDSARPRIPLEAYRANELRFNSLTRTRPDGARRMLAQAQLELEEKYRIYEDLAARDGGRFHSHWEEA
jgi:pyruvate-ferredoxin/flavodoxin oxidoreductase